MPFGIVDREGKLILQSQLCPVIVDAILVENVIFVTQRYYSFMNRERGYLIGKRLLVSHPLLET
jgi:hypothetical protein